MRLIDQIKYYFEKRGLVFPDFNNAMKWVQTELGEVYEQDLARSAKWVRNNPQDHEDFSLQKLGDELGDVVFMILVAGMAEGIDVIDCMTNKMERKLNAIGVSELVTHLESKGFKILTEEEAEEEMKDGNQS